MIESRANPTVKSLRLLSTTKGRRDQGRFLVEGIRLIEDGLASGALPHTLLYNYDLVARTDRGRILLKDLTAKGIIILESSQEAIEAASDTTHPQGIVAAFPLPRWNPPSNPSGSALAVVCDAVQDPGNLGSLLRSAEAVGATGLWLAPGSVDPYAPKVVRAAMGAHFRLPIFSLSWEEILSGLHVIGVPHSRIFATDAAAATPYDQVDWTGPAAVIVSNEAHGLSQQAREAAKSAHLISIPMAGSAESLNAAVAGSVILFEAARQRRADAGSK